MLFPTINVVGFYTGRPTFQSTRICAVPNMVLFCSSLTARFHGMLVKYFMDDFENVPFARIITGITFTLHIRCVPTVRSLRFRIFSASSLIAFLSTEIATSI